MAQYTPKVSGTSVTFHTQSDVTGGKLVALHTDGKIKHPTADTADVIGVATQDAKAGTVVGVMLGGIARLTASGAIAVGDHVIGATGGAAKKAATTTEPFSFLAITAAANGEPFDAIPRF